VFCAGAVAVWWALLVGYQIPEYLMPHPADVAAAFWTDGATLARMGWTTVSATVLGLVIATLFAGICAMAFVQSSTVASASMPILIAIRSTPVAAIAPLAMLILGRGIATSVLVVVMVAFFPILINMMRGLQAVGTQSLELLHVYGASRWQIIRMLRAPASLPYLFTGLRISGATAILGALLAEWITGNRGLGLLILESAEMREVDVLWAAIILAVVIAVTLFSLTSQAEKTVLHWKRS
jgi:ABC-type nitrate/sulfonate/bicarbonate transport system permease component